jgi:hypothetical protein
MEDARGNPPPVTSARRARARVAGRPTLPAAFVALVAPRLHDPGSPLPGLGAILGAGLTCLTVAWLLSRIGARRGRRVAPVAWARRSDETDLVGAILGFHVVEEATAPAGDPPARVVRDTRPTLVRATKPDPARARRAHPAPRPVRPRATGPAPGRTRLMRERLGFDRPRRPSATTAWLHLVSGATPAATARAACSVAASLIERGGRVLLMDAGRRCLLHARFAREARWGLGECLDGSLPVLGVVQDTGHTGLHLLARGGEPALSWHALGRLADEAHGHFEHVLLAIDPDAPRDLGGAIAGRLVEGWWAGDRLPERTARALSERLGVVFTVLPLDESSERLVESVLAAPQSIPAGAPSGLTPAPTLDSLVPGTGTWPVEIPTAVLEEPVGIVNGDETTVLACDGDVRARLEFLMWVRRMTGDAPARVPAWRLADVGVPV